MVTDDHCMSKWTKLKITKNNQIGNDKRKIQFYHELSECIRSDPKVTPGITLESDHGTGSADIHSTELVTWPLPKADVFLLAPLDKIQNL